MGHVWCICTICVVHVCCIKLMQHVWYASATRAAHVWHVLHVWHVCCVSAYMVFTAFSKHRDQLSYTGLVAVLMRLLPLTQRPTVMAFSRFQSVISCCPDRHNIEERLCEMQVDSGLPPQHHCRHHHLCHPC